MSYILLIEDNQQNADMMLQLLHSMGLEVKHFTKGLEGTQQARHEPPDLILLDLNLPDIDGRTLILTLKKQLGNNTAPPIVVVSARTGQVEMKLAQRFGCAAFISKPFLPGRFISIIQEVLAKAENSDLAAP